MSGKMLPAAGELERPIVTPTETNRNVTQFPNPNRRFSPIRNRPSIICQYISSKFVELEKYMRLHETMEKMLMSTRVNFRPSWSNTVAESKPPNGHTKVLMEAAIKALKFTTWNCLVCHNLTFFISHIKNEFFLSLQTLQLNKQTNTRSPNQLAWSSLNFSGLLSSFSASSVMAGKPSPIPLDRTEAFASKLQAILQGKYKSPEIKIILLHVI